VRHKDWYLARGCFAIYERGKAGCVIAVLVCDQNGVNTSEVFPYGRKPLSGFSPAQARVNQQSRSIGRNERRVPCAAAREYADFDDKDSTAFPLSRPSFLSVIAEFRNNFLKIVLLRRPLK
jgi:hypothetical protein